MKIQLSDQQQDLPLKQLYPLIRKAVKSVLLHEHITCESVSLVFISDEEMRHMHEQFFEDPSPTDCISFPLDGPEEESRILGEVYICPKTACTYAAENNGDPFAEVLLYVIHGLLHLIGYDDIKKQDRELMRKKEQEHLRLLNL